MGLAFELRKIEADGGEDVAAKFKEAKPTERVIDQIGEFLSGVGVRKTDWDCISVGEWHDGDEMEIDGRPVQGRVVETGPEKIVLDDNHALAGYDLRAVGKVVFVR